jgi:hypothetical protein
MQPRAAVTRLRYEGGGGMAFLFYLVWAPFSQAKTKLREQSPPKPCDESAKTPTPRPTPPQPRGRGGYGWIGDSLRREAAEWRKG